MPQRGVRLPVLSFPPMRSLAVCCSPLIVLQGGVFFGSLWLTFFGSRESSLGGGSSRGFALRRISVSCFIVRSGRFRLSPCGLGVGVLLGLDDLSGGSLRPARYQGKGVEDKHHAQARNDPTIGFC